MTEFRLLMIHRLVIRLSNHLPCAFLSCPNPPYLIGLSQVRSAFAQLRCWWRCPCFHHYVLRITIQNTSKALLLKLEGSVKGPWVEELRKAWLTSAKMADGGPVNIDLGAVSFIDANGRDLLLRMQKEGATLNGGSSFLRHMLEDGNTNSERPSEDRGAI